jgi:hypothetical protein
MPVAEELVIAVCANAPLPGHSAHKGERRQRPDHGDPKMLAKRTHFQESSRLTPEAGQVRHIPGCQVESDRIACESTAQDLTAIHCGLQYQSISFEPPTAPIDASVVDSMPAGEAVPFDDAPRRILATCLCIRSNVRWNETSIGLVMIPVANSAAARPANPWLGRATLRTFGSYGAEGSVLRRFSVWAKFAGRSCSSVQSLPDFLGMADFPNRSVSWVHLPDSKRANPPTLKEPVLQCCGGVHVALPDRAWLRAAFDRCSWVPVSLHAIKFRRSAKIHADSGRRHGISRGRKFDLGKFRGCSRLPR